MLFFHKKEGGDNVDKTLIARVEALELAKLKHDRELLECISSIVDMRDKVLRKIQKKKTDEEPENDTFGGIPKVTL